jgi:hypothetical protein
VGLRRVVRHHCGGGGGAVICHFYTWLDGHTTVMDVSGHMGMLSIREVGSVTKDWVCGMIYVGY